MAKISEAIQQLEISEYNNRKIVLSNTNGTPIRIQFPRLYMPFGISGFTPEVGQTKYNIDFALKGYDEEGSYVNNFYRSLREIEAQIIEGVAKQSEVIFGKTMSKEELTPLFNSNIKESMDREPKFRVKVDTDMNNIIKATVYDTQRHLLKDEATMGLYSRNSGHAIVELNSVYFLNKKFGCTWKLYQLMVYEPENLKGFQFQM